MVRILKEYIKMVFYRMWGHSKLQKGHFWPDATTLRICASTSQRVCMLVQTCMQLASMLQQGKLANKHTFIIVKISFIIYTTIACTELFPLNHLFILYYSRSYCVELAPAGCERSIKVRKGTRKEEMIKHLQIEI